MLKAKASASVKLTPQLDSPTAVVATVSDLQGVDGAVAAGVASAVSQRDLDIAMGLDSVAAELQLGGRWN
jgi:hypothetical protein